MIVIPRFHLNPQNKVLAWVHRWLNFIYSTSTIDVLIFMLCKFELRQYLCNCAYLIKSSHKLKVQRIIIMIIFQNIENVIISFCIFTLNTVDVDRYGRSINEYHHFWSALTTKEMPSNKIVDKTSISKTFYVVNQCLMGNIPVQVHLQRSINCCCRMSKYNSKLGINQLMSSKFSMYIFNHWP